VVAAISGARLFTTLGVRSIFLHAAILSYAIVAEAMLLYPAFSVPLAYLSLAVSACLIIDKFEVSNFKNLLWLRIVSLCLSLSAAFLILLSFYFQAQDTILKMSNTVYPGLRFSTGGGFTTDLMFLAWAFDRSGDLFSKIGGNICEGAYFYFVVPFLALPLFAISKKTEFKLKLMIASSFLIYIFLLIWSFRGFPKEIAMISGLKFSPGRRSVIALGLLDFSILLLIIRAFSESKIESQSLKKLILPFLISSVLGLYYVTQLSGQQAGFLKGSTWLPVAVILSATFLFYVGRQRIAAAIIFFAILRTTFSFNPIEIRSGSYLTNNSLAKLIVSSDSKFQDSQWIAIDSFVEGNIFRMLSVHSLGGVHFVPQVELWKRIDPGVLSKEIYNRFAHVLFDFQPMQSQEHFKFELLSPDSFKVWINPTNENLRQLGVTNILASCKKSGTIMTALGWSSLGSLNDYCLWGDDKFLRKI